MRTFGLKIVALICILSTQAKGELISTNLVNSDVQPVGYYFKRLGVTKSFNIPAGKQLVIHGINLSPSSDTRGSSAFVRKPVATDQYINIATVSQSHAQNIYWNGPIVGPMDIEYGLIDVVWGGQASEFPRTYCTFLFEIKDSTLEASTATTANISSASVVVPSNAVGDVDVLLEQSNDMITWTQCLPGTYNASTQKRFFRVRAVEK
jgi:hypothetical protein